MTASPTNSQPKRPHALDWRVEGVFLAVWAALGVGVYVLGFQPQAEAARRSASDIDRLAVHEQELDQVHALARAAAHRLEKARQQRDTTPVRLGRPSEINVRLGEISALAEQSGIKLDQLEPGKPAVYARYAVVPIRLAGATTFPGLVGFFNDLHHKFPDTGSPGFRLSANQDQAVSAGRFAIDLAWHTAPDRKPDAK